MSNNASHLAKSYPQNILYAGIHQALVQIHGIYSKTRFGLYWLALSLKMKTKKGGLTGSPPEANEMLGISCDATTCPASRVVSVSAEDVMVRVTLLPACSIRGRSPMMRPIDFTTFRLRSTVFRPAASHTLLIHSLWKWAILTDQNL